jgi:hypothetical protein
MNAHVLPPNKKASSISNDIECQFDTLQKSIEILCWLSEEVEKNVAAIKRSSLIAGGATFDDLAEAQAYVIKGMVAELRESWDKLTEEMGL